MVKYNGNLITAKPASKFCLCVHLLYIFYETLGSWNEGVRHRIILNFLEHMDMEVSSFIFL